MISIIVVAIVFDVILFIIEAYKKKAETLMIESECFQSIKELLHENNIDILSNKVKIDVRKEFQYRPRDNSIGVKNLNSHKCSDMIPSLHEVGHYIEINKSKKTTMIFKYSQYLIAINRLIIIPLYIIGTLLEIAFTNSTFFLNNQVINRVMIYYFIFAFILRLIIGFPNEIFASRHAFNFIKKRYNREIISLSRKMYFASFFSQLLLFILIINLIFHIVYYIK